MVRKIQSHPPILVTGSHRSGSTWMGNILALDRSSGYIHEPFNRRHRKGVCRARFKHTYTYITDENEAPYLAPLGDTLAWRFSPAAQLRQIKTARDLAVMARNMSYFEIMRLRQARPIMKDPIALFSAPWLAERFDMQVVIAIRHPAAFVASLKVAGWDRFPFADLRDQELLMRDQLTPFRSEIVAAAEQRLDVIDMGILLWRIFHHQISRYQTDHPDWIFLRHEDLSREPVPTFRDLFERLDLEFSKPVSDKLQTFTKDGAHKSNLLRPGNSDNLVRDSKKNVSSWKNRLSPDEIDRIRSAVTPLCEQFYDATDW